MKPHQLILALLSVAACLALANGAEKHAAKRAQEPRSNARQDSATKEAPGKEASALAQQAADKKQAADSAQDPLLGADEYVHIKPEEVGAGEQSAAKELALLEAPVAPNESGQQQAEHKSAADEELSAHLAQDTIAQQESAYRPAYAPGALRPLPAPHHAYSGPAPAAAATPLQHSASRAAPYKAPQVAGYARGARSPAAVSGPSRLPPSYITLKGKLTGINSIISQYPHPAPGYPHQGPRHLPRGAAAGYAAFRDFVRAHASKYRQPSAGRAPALMAPQQQTGYAPQEQSGGYQQPAAKEQTYSSSTPVAPSYGQSYSAAAAAASYGGSAPAGYGAGATPMAPSYGENAYQSKGNGAYKTKLTVAQAYIPQASLPQGSGYGSGSGYQQQAAMAAYTNPILSKLYGGHAPQGAGKAEYSKDFGMVIHYPQATVYTEPMTVEQLHKLTGSGITQVIEQLQYNLATGAHQQRDESNTIRAHNKHHLGDGLSIHAKEYYAPGKHGRYVPTTAAVISSSGPKYAAAGYEGSEMMPEYDPASMGAPEQGYGQQAVQLGSGYERVKQAAAAGGQEKYSNKMQPQSYAQPPQGGAASDNYKQAAGNGEPLSAITNLYGSELDSLYKANAALTRHLDPEIQQALSKALYGKSQPLKYRELANKSPFTAHGFPFAAAPARPQYAQPGRAPHRPRGGRGPRRGNAYPRHPQHQRRPPAGYPAQQAAYAGSKQQGYQQQAAEQELNNQMMQLLHDFRSSDEQYNGKTQPSLTSQGYPHKVLQRYQQPAGGYQQQQQQPQPQQQSQEAPLELPQGPNDQIGEVADLIEALKGALDLSKPEPGSGAGYSAVADGYQSQQGKQANGGKLEDVHYLANALGQTPSYAMQVPVGQPAAAQAAPSSSYEPAKKEQAYAQTAGQEQAYQQPQAPEQTAYASQEPAFAGQQSAYGTQQSSYGAQQSSYGAQQTSYNAQPAAYGAQPAAYGSQQAASPQQSAGYGQQQQQQQQSSAYSQAQPAANYNQQAYSQPLQPQQQAGYAGQQQADGGAAYGQPAQASGHSDYSAGAVGEQPAAPSAGASGYSASQPAASGASSQSYAQSQGDASAAYGQQQQQAQAQQPAAGYTSSEHTQVINHLVPLAGQQVAQAGHQAAGAAQGAYADASHSSGGGQQPAGEALALAAPTEAQFQQAQSLSSFVDSLSTDYHELLRQPAQLAAAANAAQQQADYASNATSAASAYGQLSAAASSLSVSAQAPDSSSQSAQVGRLATSSSSSSSQPKQTSAKSQQQAAASAGNSQQHAAGGTQHK